MREPEPIHRIYGLLAEFDRAEALVEAARRARAAGYREVEGFSPFPIDAMNEALALQSNGVPLACLAGGIGGGLIGFFMQVYANLDFPLNVGGRPLVAPEAFALITFEMTVLGAVLSTLLALFLLNRLPRLNHPLFEAPDFHRASSDRFFLLIQANDPQFDEAKVRRFLHGLHPLAVEAPPFTEEPE